MNGPRPGHDYITDGAEIYRRSFAMIREESDLSAFTPEQEVVAVRMIHAAGDVDLARDIRFSDGAVASARGALRAGAPILADVSMVATGVTRRRLPAGNDVVCTLSDPRTADLAGQLGTTRTAASVELWADRLDGAVVAVGNAPTALFHLLDGIRDGHLARPAAILALPVGFVGAAESKQEVVDAAGELGLEYVTVLGRRGGSAITVAAINALAREEEIL